MTNVRHQRSSTRLRKADVRIASTSLRFSAAKACELSAAARGNEILLAGELSGSGNERPGINAEATLRVAHLSRAMLEPSNVVVVVGACGGIGSSLVWALERHPRFEAVVPLHRGSKPALDVTDEESVGRAAAFVRAQYGEVRCIVVATGLLHDGETFPERSLDGISAAQLSRYFAVNAIGPALVIKHFAPLLSRGGRSVIACLSARVGSISDNHLGGWYGYRASKAALNQLVRTAAIEIARKRPEAICVAIHPGTVDTALSAPFSKTGLNVRSAQIAGTELIGVLDQLRTEDNGCFLDYRGGRIEW